MNNAVKKKRRDKIFCLFVWNSLFRTGGGLHSQPSRSTPLPKIRSSFHQQCVYFPASWTWVQPWLALTIRRRQKWASCKPQPSEALLVRLSKLYRSHEKHRVGRLDGPTGGTWSKSPEFRAGERGKRPAQTPLTLVLGLGLGQLFQGLFQQVRQPLQHLWALLGAPGGPARKSCSGSLHRGFDLAGANRRGHLTLLLSRSRS